MHSKGYLDHPWTARSQPFASRPRKDPAPPLDSETEPVSDLTASLRGRAVGADLQHLEAVLLGEVKESVAGWLVALSREDSNPLADRVPCVVSYGPEGVLILASEAVTASPMDLEAWPGSSPYLSNNLVLIPWPYLTGLTLGSDGSQVTLWHGSDETAIVELHPPGAEWFTKYALEVAGVAEQPDGETEDVWAQLIMDVLAVLAEHGLADEALITSTLIADYGWDSVDPQDLEEILWSPDAPTQFMPHVWFYDYENAVEHADLPEMTRMVLDTLATEPLQAQPILDAVHSAGMTEASIEDVYDVLYDPGLPTYKYVRAWYSTVDEAD